jgi:Mce-associated membrane protein
VTGTLAVALAAAVVASVFLGLEVRRTAELERQRAEAVRTARQLVVDFLTHDYRSFDQTRRNVLALSSGDFAEQYRASATKLRDFVRQVRSVSEGEVLDAGVVSFDPDSARVLVVADAEVTNAATESPQPRHYRIQVDLSREEAGWRVVDLTFVG